VRSGRGDGMDVPAVTPHVPQYRTREAQLAPQSSQVQCLPRATRPPIRHLAG
jgi:hypothetical protein